MEDGGRRRLPPPGLSAQAGGPRNPGRLEASSHAGEVQGLKVFACRRSVLPNHSAGARDPARNRQPPSPLWVWAVNPLTLRQATSGNLAP